MKISSAMKPDSGDTFPSQTGPHDEAPHEQPGDRDRHRHRPHRDETEIEAAETRSPAMRKRAPNAVARWLSVISANAQKSPEHEGVRQPGQRPLLDHFALQHDFPEKLPDARAQRRDFEIRRRRASRG